MLNRKSLLLNYVGLALILLSFATAFAQAPAAGETPKAPAYQWPRSHDYDVQHYRIKLAFDWAAKSQAI